MPRLIAYINCLDPEIGTGSEVYEEGAVRPVLWKSGWSAFYDEMGIDDLRDAGVFRFMLGHPFGWYRSTDAKTIGYGPSQAAVTSRSLGPRQAETDLQDDRLVNGRPTTGDPAFAEFWIAKTAQIVGAGGDLICLMASPPFDTSTDAYTIDNWVREPESCNMGLALDSAAGCDRLSYMPPAAVLEARLASRSRARYVTQHEATSSYLSPWYETGAMAISGKTRADLVVATPSSYLTPIGGRQSIVILDSSIAAGTRVAAALTYMGQSSNGSPWVAAVDMTGLTAAQVAMLVDGGG